MKKGYLYLIVTLFCWGSLYVAGKFALDYVPPMTLLLMRQTLALIVIGFIVAKTKLKKVKREHILHFIAIGTCGYFLSTNLQTLSTNVMDASVSALVNSVNPIFISILAVLFLKEKMNIFKVIGIIVSVIGVCIVIGIDTQNISYLGVLFAVLSVLFWSISSIVIRKIANEYSTFEITFWGLVFAYPMCAIASLVEMQSSSITMDPKALLAIVYMALFSTTVANILYNKSLAILDASTCSLFYPLQTVFATVLGIVLLNESINLNFIIGGILISIGIVVGLIEKKEPSNNDLILERKVS